MAAAASQGLYDAALCAAFWVALAGYRGDAGAAPRFVAGLALGALLGRAGGLLYTPVGLLLAAPWRAPARSEFLAAGWPALPLAFATAKLGCLAAGCCAAAGFEALGFGAAGAALRLAPRRHHAALALAGIAAVRLAALPLRPGAGGSAGLAAVWLALAALHCRPSRGDPRCRRPGNATSSRTPRSSRPGCAAGSPARATSA
jgi:hypothetical protein